MITTCTNAIIDINPLQRLQHGLLSKQQEISPVESLGWPPWQEPGRPHRNPSTGGGNGQKRLIKGRRVGWRREMCCNVFTFIERMVFLAIFEVSTLMRKYSSPGSLVAPMIFSAVSPRANPLGLLRVNISKQRKLFADGPNFSLAWYQASWQTSTWALRHHQLPCVCCRQPPCRHLRVSSHTLR